MGIIAQIILYCVLSSILTIFLFILEIKMHFEEFTIKGHFIAACIQSVLGANLVTAAIMVLLNL